MRPISIFTRPSSVSPSSETLEIALLRLDLAVESPDARVGVARHGLELDQLDAVPIEIYHSQGGVVDVNVAGDVIGHAAHFVLGTVPHPDVRVAVASRVNHVDVTEPGDEHPRRRPVVVVDGDFPLIK
jgi:hypothetical protein